MVSVTSTSTNTSGYSGNDLEINPGVVLDLGVKSLAVSQADRGDDNRTNRINFVGGITGTGNLKVTNNDNFNNNGGQTRFAAINMTGSITANPTSATGGRILFDGSIGSNVNGGFTKNGAGVAELLAANSYGGGTTVNAGTLIDDRAHVFVDGAYGRVILGAVLALQLRIRRHH